MSVHPAPPSPPDRSACGVHSGGELFLTLLISMFANFMAISSAVIWDEAAAVMLVFRSRAYLQRYLMLMDEDEITDNEELINPALGGLLWALSCHFIMSFAVVRIEFVVSHFREYGCFGFGKSSGAEVTAPLCTHAKKMLHGSESPTSSPCD